MLQILQTRHIENYAELLCRLGLEGKHANVVEATENDTITGIGVYRMTEDGVAIDYAEYNDLLLCDGIVRSILFLAYMRGAVSAYVNQEDKRLLSDCVKLRLCDESGRLEKISSVLDGCENCKHKNM